MNTFSFNFIRKSVNFNYEFITGPYKMQGSTSLKEMSTVLMNIPSYIINKFIIPINLSLDILFHFLLQIKEVDEVSLHSQFTINLFLLLLGHNFI